MDDTCKDLLFLILKGVGAIIGTIFAGWVAYTFAIMAGRVILLKKSIHDTAEIFVKEAAAWVGRSDYPKDDDIVAHDESIRRLEAYISYIQKNYPETWRRIESEWKWFSFYGIDPPRNHSNYKDPDRRRKNFVASLYAMADEIRKA